MFNFLDIYPACQDAIFLNEILKCEQLVISYLKLLHNGILHNEGSGIEHFVVKHST